MKILGRDPAFWTGLVAVAVQFLVAWRIDLSEGQQAAINAVAAALVGVIVAWTVSRDQVVAVAAGLLTAVLQLFVAFGVDFDQEQIATAGALLVAVLTGFLRTQVTAPVAPDGTRVPKTTVSTR
jgi:nicotinamide riboside transporter PnuC